MGTAGNRRRVLVIQGSLRVGGHTAHLCHELTDCLPEECFAISYIHLGQQRILPCLGCRACRANGGQCVQKDDMQGIYPLLQQAQELIVASPVYFYNFTASMKLFMDRTYALRHSWPATRVHLLLTAHANAADCEPLEALFQRYVACFPRMLLGGVLIAGGMEPALDAELPADVAAKAHALAQHIAETE